MLVRNSGAMGSVNSSLWTTNQGLVLGALLKSWNRWQAVSAYLLLTVRSRVLRAVGKNVVTSLLNGTTRNVYIVLVLFLWGLYRGDHGSVRRL